MTENIILCLFAGLFLLLTITTFIPINHWLVRGLDFARIQLAVLGLLLFTVFWFIEPGSAFHMICLSVIIACTIYHIYVLLPYLPFYPKQVKDNIMNIQDRKIRVLEVNVFYKNRNSHDITERIRKEIPDLILFIEPDKWWEEKLRVLENEYPYTVKKPMDNTYGMILISKYELIDPEVKFLMKDEIPSIFTKVKLPSEDIIEFVGLHPEPPTPNDNVEDRDRELYIAGEYINKNSSPTIVAGDFNDVQWSPTSRKFRQAGKLLDPRVGRAFCNTFHAGYAFLRGALDHVYVTKEFRVVKFERLICIGSDHFGVIAELSYEPESASDNEEPEDNRQMEDKVEEKRRS